jgi:hypothetical protein
MELVDLVVVVLAEFPVLMQLLEYKIQAVVVEVQVFSPHLVPLAATVVPVS